MAANQFKEFISIGEALGLTGPDLLNFAKEQIEADRVKRLEEREVVKQEQAALRQEQEAVRQAAKEQKELELKLIEAQRQLIEDQKSVSAEQRQFELQREADSRKFELQKLEIESETKLKCHELSSKTQISLAEKSNDVEESTSSTNNWVGKKFDLGLGIFDNVAENLDSFISRFEIVAKAYELPSQLWPIEFSKCLNGESLTVYEMLDYESKTDFDALIQALRKKYNISEGSYRRLFKTSKPLKSERLSDFVWRLKHYLKMWLQKSKCKEDYDGLFELIVSHAFFQSLDKNAQIFLRERGKLSLEEMVGAAQNYVDAHPNFDRGNQNVHKKPTYDKPVKKEVNREPSRPEYRSGGESKPTVTRSDSSHKVIKCYLCGQAGHKSYACTSERKAAKKNDDSHSHKAAACQLESLCDDNIQGNCEIFPVLSLVEPVDGETYLHDLKYPFKGQAQLNGQKLNYMRDTGSTLTIVQDKYVDASCLTGNKVSVLLADRCVKYLPEAVVHLKCPCFNGDVKVLVMSNPVYPLIIGNNVFQNETVRERSFSDEFESNSPVIKTVIFENSAFLESQNRPVASEQESNVRSDPVNVHDVVSSELTDVKQVSDIEPVVSAVQTRAQAKCETKAVRPLKHATIDALNISPSEFSKLQKEDKTLSKYWKLVESHPVDDEHKAHFVVRNDILYRDFKSGPHDDIIEQVVVPECLREKVILYAHETTLSGHMGINATYKKLCTNFFIPGAMEWCKRVVLSCLKCQQGANKNVGGKAPLQSLPIISEPFHTVYIDLIGKIEPSSSDGHSYILTIMDSATHFVIAVPLKKTDSVSIAEALMKQFDLVGYPQRIYNDNGSNLSSDIMKEIYRTFGIQMKTIPVYWPRANLVERQHGIIKSIMRKLIVDQPRQWHRYLDALMFAIRTTPNASGYSPFELLFGRQGRSHLTFLKELWTGRNDDPETKDTYQYVLDLQNRIAETCDFAQKELSKVRDRNRKQFNTNAKLRQLKPQDRVWVLNTRSQGKFDFNWIGPATVLERRGHVVYKIKFDNGNERMYHINMLKPFVSRESAQADQNKLNLSDEVNQLQVDDVEQTDENEISAAVMGLVEDSDTDDDETVETNRGLRLGEEPSHVDIANLEQTETWKDVKVNPDLSQFDQDRIWNLVREYADIFSDVPTITNLVTYDIKVKTDEPIRHKPYKIPVHLVDKVEAELQKMVKLGWIERNDNPEYASPMVIVKKRDSDELRLCVSYKSLNAITVIDSTPQPDIEDILARFGKAKFFSVCDACKGFYAVKMNEDAKKYTSFVTPRDCYVFNVCPFGLVNAPSVYAKLTRKLLHELDNVDNFVDDLITYTNDLDQHLVTLRELFDRVRNANLKLKPSKVKLGFTEIAFLGQIIGNGTVRPTQENIEKILNAPIPRTKKGVRSLCGMVNWLRKFIPGAARLLKPLTDLTSKRHSDVVQWGPEQQEAWDEVKKALTTQPVLTLYDSSKEHVLMTDASDNFVGGVMMQREDDGNLHPVMYASRKCVDRETRYDIQNKEMLAIVWCCSRFYRFLYGAPFVIQTDCCALSLLNGKLSNNARVVRWQLYLQSFNFRVEVIRGKDNCIADFMSRMGT